MLFLKETVEPNFPVRVGIGNTLRKVRWAFEMKVNNADKRDDWIKGCGSRG
jgi:hypothetical protein